MIAVTPIAFAEGNCFTRCLAASITLSGLPLDAGLLSFWERGLIPVLDPASDKARPALGFRHSSRAVKSLARLGLFEPRLSAHPTPSRLVERAKALRARGVYAAVFLNPVHLDFSDDYRVRPGGKFANPHAALFVRANADSVVLMDPTPQPGSDEGGYRRVAWAAFRQACTDGLGIPGHVPNRLLEIRVTAGGAGPLDRLVARENARALATYVALFGECGPRGRGDAVHGPRAWLDLLGAARHQSEENHAAILLNFHLQVHYYFRQQRAVLHRAHGARGAAAAKLLAGLKEVDAMWTGAGQVAFLASRRFSAPRLEAIEQSVRTAIALEAELWSALGPGGGSERDAASPDELRPEWTLIGEG